MATGLQLPLRRALLARLASDAGLTALVPAANIDPQGEAVWPFILIESPVSQQLRAACVRGATITFDVHAFAGPRKSGEQVVETARDHAGRIGGEIERVLADNRIPLTGGPVARIELSDMRLLRDEPGGYHWFAQINARVLAAATL